MWKAIEAVGYVRIMGIDRLVRLSNAGGTGGTSFSLNVDNYYWGVFINRQGKWDGPEELSKDENDILIAMIEDAISYPRLSLELEVPIGDVYRHVSIFEPRPRVYTIHMHNGADYYYRGTITGSGSEWTGEINFGNWDYLTSDDIWILGNIINQHKG